MACDAMVQQPHDMARGVHSCHEQRHGHVQVPRGAQQGGDKCAAAASLGSFTHAPDCDVLELRVALIAIRIRIRARNRARPFRGVYLSMTPGLTRIAARLPLRSPSPSTSLCIVCPFSVIAVLLRPLPLPLQPVSVNSPLPCIRSSSIPQPSLDSTPRNDAFDNGS
jgi:hypothetical protein